MEAVYVLNHHFRLLLNFRKKAYFSDEDGELKVETYPKIDGVINRQQHAR